MRPDRLPMRSALLFLLVWPLWVSCGQADRGLQAQAADASPDLTSWPADASADLSADASAELRCSPPLPTTQRDVPYRGPDAPANDARARLDIYRPPDQGCGKPIVIWVHGGAWQTGDKTRQMTHKVPFFAQLGVVFISVNYRLSAVDNQVRHPDHVEDVAAAVAWVRERAAAFGGDPSRIALLGHSAGAHLVALLATNPRFLAAHGMAPRDLACVGSYDSEYTVEDIIARDESYKTVFGDDPAAWRDASPSAHVSPGLPPIQLACRGSARRREQCEQLALALRAAGNQALTIDASALDHEGVNDALGRPEDQVMTPPMKALLEAYLLGPGAP